ncbi:hypothetical protein SCAR479_12257 [Seiridium cardinale]|uniref:Uncharacterized protein n=1 Tax=Seiridium cardinale TaxID=138064 RepID=A0ABR2XBC3_9PEZI
MPNPFDRYIFIVSVFKMRCTTPVAHLILTLQSSNTLAAPLNGASGSNPIDKSQDGSEVSLSPSDELLSQDNARHYMKLEELGLDSTESTGRSSTWLSIYDDTSTMANEIAPDATFFTVLIDRRGSGLDSTISSHKSGVKTVTVTIAGATVTEFTTRTVNIPEPSSPSLESSATTDQPWPIPTSGTTIWSTVTSEAAPPPSPEPITTAPPAPSPTLEPVTRTSAASSPPPATETTAPPSPLADATFTSVAASGELTSTVGPATQILTS